MRNTDVRFLYFFTGTFRANVEHDPAHGLLHADRLHILKVI